MTQEYAGAEPAPLEGIRVLDFSHVLAGPFASMMLGDLGADIIKIEKPGRGDTTRGTPPVVDGISTFYSAWNRNKRSVAVDLKSPEGVAIVKRLAEHCDVLLHNFRPSAMDRLGLGPADLQAINPRLVYCGLSGYGQNSTLREYAAFDTVIQAITGVMSLTGELGQPPGRSGLSIGDLSGGMFSVIGILSALQKRERTGLGSVVDVALFDAVFNLVGNHFTYTQTMGRPPDRSGAMHPSIVPMGRLRTADGYVILAAFNQKFWRNICRAVDRPEWLEDPRFASMRDRAANREALRAELEAIVQTRTTAEWAAICLENDVPCGPVLSLDEVLELPTVAERRLLDSVGEVDGKDIRVTVRPIKISGLDGGVRLPPPRLGQDTRVVLSEILAMDDAEIGRLADAGVLAVEPSTAP